VDVERLIDFSIIRLGHNVHSRRSVSDIGSPPKASDPKSQLPSLTSFRGIAALWVVLYHYTAVYFYQLNPSNYTHLVEKGYLAVDLFFMLSGFVLTHVYRRAFSSPGIAESYRGFLLARVARLYPLHIVILLLFVATAFTSQLMAFAATGRFQSVPLQGPQSLTAFIANLFMLQGLEASRLSWNYPSWSISIEFVAYLLFPFLLPTIWRAPPVYKVAFAAFLISTLSCFAYFNADNFNQWDGPQTLLRCLPEFLLGMLLYSVFRSTVCATVLDQDSFALVIFLITLLALHFGGPDIAIVLLFAILMLSIVVNTGMIAKIAATSSLIWLGNISYSVYLLHGLIQFVVAKILNNFGVPNAADLPVQVSFALLVAMVTVCLGLATATYYSVESVGRRYLKQLFGLRRRVDRRRNFAIGSPRST
jgi:peptidoglycan/LPS O-acetylase OafA/YrhL